MLALSPVNIAKTMSRIDNHAIIVACLDDRRVAPGVLRQNGLKMQRRAKPSV